MNLIVHLQEQAFQAMLIASIETFPSSYMPQEQGAKKRRENEPHDGEAMGLLFGQRVMKNEYLIYNVGLAVPMQATNRDPNWVQYSDFHFERIREFTESFPHLEFLGTFHSHPWRKDEYGNGATKPSEADVSSAIDDASKYGDELLEIILGITAMSRNSYRDAKVEGHSIDSYCGRYKYRLSAYCTDGTVTEEIEECDDEACAGQDDVEASLLPVFQLICPMAAHGGAIYT